MRVMFQSNVITQKNGVKSTCLRLKKANEEKSTQSAGRLLLTLITRMLKYEARTVLYVVRIICTDDL